MRGRRPSSGAPPSREDGRNQALLGEERWKRPFLSRLWQLGLVAGLVALLGMAPAGAAEPSPVALNEINCTGTDWVELINRGDAEVSLANWLLTDDPLDRVPLRDTHRMRFAPDAVLAPGARLLVTQGVGGFPFGLSCGDDTLRLADAADTPVDAFTLPVLATAGMTYGRIPDGTGEWTLTAPTAGAANVAASAGQDDPAWLYDPLQVSEIDLEASEAALSQLNADPGEYVEARLILRNGGITYGPYIVGLRLKGTASFRPLGGKAAFKVKFGYGIAGERFFGLKGLTLNNMVQDPSMIAEATTALALAATGGPAARVGYAYVRLNGVEYGLYANVENVDAVMARRWFTSTQHVYEGELGADASPGRAEAFEVDEGSSSDRSDLEALAAANAAGADGWWERMQPVADLVAMTRVWAAEHYAGHWDGYSVSAGAIFPANYYLHSDVAGRFSLITLGTDQTWQVRTPFGVFGTGVLFRGCVANATCRELYVDALRQMAASSALAALPAQARTIRAAISPWRVRDPRREQSAAGGEAHADATIATLDARPAELAAWLDSPSFVAAVEPTAAGDAGVSDQPIDLAVSGTVTPASAPVGGSHVWRLHVKNSGTTSAFGVVLDVQLSPNVVYGFSQTTRGAGCAAVETGVRCSLDWLEASPAYGATAEVVVGTNVTGAGVVSLAATASSAGPDPTPADNTLTLVANSPAAEPQKSTPAAARPLLGKPSSVPARPVAGRRFTFSLPVTRSDSGGPLRTGKMICAPTVGGKMIRHSESFRAGKARLTFLVPKTATGKTLKVKITVTALSRTVSRTFSYAVR